MSARDLEAAPRRRAARTRRRRLTATLLATSAFALLSASLAWAVGELTQRPGADGCISDVVRVGFDQCSHANGLVNPVSVVTSPDGEDVYVTGGGNAVAALDRDPETGGLRANGCISENGSRGRCVDGFGLDGGDRVAISPDGESVYVASFFSSAIAIFDRDPETGRLTQLPGDAGCVSEGGTGGLCGPGRAMTGLLGVTVSPDGESVYGVSPLAAAVLLFDRDPATGGLTQKPGKSGCISLDTTGGLCEEGRALGVAASVVASPDGRSVYVVGQSEEGAIAVFDRDPESGELRQKAGEAGCIDERPDGGCGPGRALVSAFGGAVSPDGRSFYAVGRSDAIAVFDRDPQTGALTQKRGRTGCISEDGSGGVCEDGVGLDEPLDVVVSPDGVNVYVTSQNSDAVAIFDRDPATGALTQPGGLPCISETGFGACADGTALLGATGVAVSPDGRNVYAGSLFLHAVALLNRARPEEPEPEPEPDPTPEPQPTPTPEPQPTATPAPQDALPPAPHRDPPARDAAPAVSRVALSSSVLRRGRAARIRFTLSEPATVEIAIARARAGRRVGGRCAAPTPGTRTRPRCTRFVRSGAATHPDRPAGRNAIALRARIGGRALAPGGYRATLTATDRAGNRSAPRAVRFTVR